MNKTKQMVVIGGGAAGFFGAVTAARAFPGSRVIILEKSNKLLSKVKISGGGRCNVTHACYERSRLVKSYPPGRKKPARSVHPVRRDHHRAVVRGRGVRLKTEPDGRMFPVTDNSQTIVDCLWPKPAPWAWKIRTGWGVKGIDKDPDTASVRHYRHGRRHGAGRPGAGSPRAATPTGGAYAWLERLGHRVMPPVPSLFTFNVPTSPLLDLAGVSVPEAVVKVSGTKLLQNGPLLVTHWGFSGPAVLKLSAWGARDLAGLDYRFQMQVNWVPGKNEDAVRADLSAYRDAHPKQTVAANPLYGLPQRLWKRLVEGAEIGEALRWADLPKKNLNKLIDALVHSTYHVDGKSTYKDEFVTCGGIAAGEVEWQTMESRRCPGLFFAGEILDVDGITGGFNFQNAWTTGYIAERTWEGNYYDGVRPWVEIRYRVT
jgi:predicted Rossmann fold flavoprotein